MSINVTDNFKLRSNIFLDNRIIVENEEALLNWNTASNPLPAGFEVCIGSTWYVYKPEMTPEEAAASPTGYFVKRADAVFSSGQAVNTVSISDSSSLSGSDDLFTGNAIAEYVSEHGGGSGGSTIEDTNGDTIAEVTLDTVYTNITSGNDDLFSGGAIHDYIANQLKPINDKLFPFSGGISSPAGNILKTVGEKIDSQKFVLFTKKGNDDVSDSSSFAYNISGSSEWPPCGKEKTFTDITGNGHNQTTYTYSFIASHPTYSPTAISLGNRTISFGFYCLKRVTESLYNLTTNRPSLDSGFSTQDLGVKSKSSSKTFTASYVTTTTNYPVFCIPVAWVSNPKSLIATDKLGTVDSWLLLGRDEATVPTFNRTYTDEDTNSTFTIPYYVYQKESTGSSEGKSYTYTLTVT